MDKIVIEGGKPLKGVVSISGAKNAALPVMAACLLTGGWHRLERIPRLRDIQTIRRIMSNLGVVFREDGGALHINSDNLTNYQAPYDLVKTMRASILLLGPLLARCGRAKISLPGGCAIGQDRSICTSRRSWPWALIYIWTMGTSMPRQRG